MKLRSFLVILMMAIGLLTSVEVKAAEVEESSSIEPEDDLGEQTYSLDFFMASTDTNNPVGYLCRKSSGSITVDGARLCGYREYLSSNNCYVYYIYTYNSTTCYPGITLSTTTGTGITGCYLYLSESWYMKESKNDSFNYKEYDYLLSPYLMRIYPDCDWQYISTSIPIFEGKEQMLAFMNGEIGIENSINYLDGVLDIQHGSSEVPVPHNVKVVEENGHYYLTWDNTSEEVELIDAPYIHHYLSSFAVSKNGAEYLTDKYFEFFGVDLDAEIDYEFENILVQGKQLVYKIDITAQIKNFDSWAKEYCDGYTYKGYQACLQFDVANVINRSTSSTPQLLFSNWVQVQVALEWTENGGLDIDVSYSEIDGDGNYAVDSEYNDVTIGSGGSDMSGNFIYNLLTGFGMLGDNGLLSFMKGVFSCFPSFIWELLGTGLSAMIIVALFKTLFS